MNVSGQRQRLTEAPKVPLGGTHPLGRQHLNTGSRVATHVHRSHVYHVLSKNCSGTEMKSAKCLVLRLAPASTPYGEGCSKEELPLGQMGRLANLLDLHVCPWACPVCWSPKPRTKVSQGLRD